VFRARGPLDQQLEQREMLWLVVQAFGVPLYAQPQRHRWVFDALDDPVGRLGDHAQPAADLVHGLLVARVAYGHLAPAEQSRERRVGFDRDGVTVPRLDLALAVLDGAGPVVAPPVYGRWQSARDAVPADTATPAWLRDLNLDPSARATAGLGVVVVQAEQEELVAAAWNQLGDPTAVRAVERRLEVAVAVLGIAVVLALLASRLPEPGPPERQPLQEVATLIVSRPVLVATAFVAVPSLMFGAAEVLVPLRIDELGGGHVAIAVGFIVGAALEAGLAPAVGRYSDRVGRRIPFVAGVSICAAAMVVLAVADVLGAVLAALVLASLGAGICFAPALTALSDSADLSGLHQGFAVGLSNMAWAAGQTVGALAGGAVASASGYALPSLAVAALLLLTSAYAYRSLVPPLIQPAES